MFAWYSVFNNLVPNVSLLPNEDHNYNFTSVNLTQIHSAIEAICKQSWSDVPKPDKHRPFLCFFSTHHWTILEYGYSMNNENLKHFQIIKTIDSNEIGWTLGYMINQTNYLDPEYRPSHLLTQAEFIGLVVLLIIGTLVTITMTYDYKKRRIQ